MTHLIAALARLFGDARVYLVATSCLSLLFAAFGTWSFWRVRRLLAVLPLIEERVTVLSNSVSLLTDTTEDCFKAMAIQLEAMRRGTERPNGRRPPQVPEPVANPSRGRQRRVVGAARRGEPLNKIAAREEVAEGEVALRVQMSEQEAALQSKRYGDLLS